MKQGNNLNCKGFRMIIPYPKHFYSTNLPRFIFQVFPMALPPGILSRTINRNFILRERAKGKTLHSIEVFRHLIVRRNCYSRSDYRCMLIYTIALNNRRSKFATFESFGSDVSTKRTNSEEHNEIDYNALYECPRGIRLRNRKRK